MENLQKILLQKSFHPIETCLLPSGLFLFVIVVRAFFPCFLPKARYLITSSKIRWGVKKESIRRVTLHSEKVSRPLKWKTNKEILLYYLLKIPKKFLKCSVLLFLLNVDSIVTKNVAYILEQAHFCSTEVMLYVNYLRPWHSVILASFGHLAFKNFYVFSRKSIKYHQPGRSRDQRKVHFLWELNLFFPDKFWTK